MCFMGFSLSKSLEEEVVKLVNSKDWDPEQAAPIPDTPGMVLVKHGSNVFQERKAIKGILMIPVVIKGISDGMETEALYLVCTK